MKKAVKILKDVQSYKTGNTYRLHKSFANNLIAKGKAEEVKQEKAVIETKEEKHAPAESKETLSIAKLTAVISEYTEADLKHIIDADGRVTAVKLAQAELAKR